MGFFKCVIKKSILSCIVIWSLRGVLIVTPTHTIIEGIYSPVSSAGQMTEYINRKKSYAVCLQVINRRDPSDEMFLSIGIKERKE